MRLVAGIDEAGRGPLAGPVTAACVVLDTGFADNAITDSKKLTSKQRDKLFEIIISNSKAFSIVSVGPRRIEQLNIRQATKLAMKLAAKRVGRILHEKNYSEGLHLLIDGDMLIDTEFSQEAIIKGDEKVMVISAASILAKVTRDRLMCLLDRKFPNYNFAIHKGYPTKKHQELIRKFRPCKIHRRNFSGVFEYL